MASVMREIKFRVWNGIEWCGLIKPGEIVNPNDYGSTEDLVFQQFTGFKDSTGKEVYEGDIINDDYHGNCEVVFNEGSFVFEDIGHSEGDEFYLTDTKNYKVIGNVLENLNLLDPLKFNS